MAELQNRLDPYPPVHPRSNQATALPQVSKRLEKRFSHHYYVYQGSVRLNSAFKGKRVEEMAAMR